MKKFRSIVTLISVLCVISLCFSGCGSTQEDKKTDDGVKQEQQTDISEKDSEAANTPAQGIVEKGFYYTVTLPSDWQGIYTGQDVEDSGISFKSFYQSASLAQEGGHLFSIMLMPEAEDYTQFPAYEHMGILKTPKGDFNVVAVYPTDVQFSEDTATEYNKMAAEVETIISTFEAVEGAEFVKK